MKNDPSGTQSETSSNPPPKQGGETSGVNKWWDLSPVLHDYGQNKSNQNATTSSNSPAPIQPPKDIDRGSDISNLAPKKEQVQTEQSVKAAKKVEELAKNLQKIQTLTIGTDFYGKVVTLPQAQFDALIERQIFEYHQQVADNIRGGLGGTLAYSAGSILKDRQTGEKLSFAGAQLDNVAAAAVAMRSPQVRPLQGPMIKPVIPFRTSFTIWADGNIMFERMDMRSYGNTYYHYTNIEGVSGITGLNTNVLKHMQSNSAIEVHKLTFKTGNVGTSGTFGSLLSDIYITTVPPTVSDGKLFKIGVFNTSGKSEYAISFNQYTLYSHGIRVNDAKNDRAIYTIQGNNTISGRFLIFKR